MRKIEKIFYKIVSTLWVIEINKKLEIKEVNNVLSKIQGEFLDKKAPSNHLKRNIGGKE